MSQFTVHRNLNPATRGRFPLLLDVQADLLDGLDTRVVIPLAPATPAARRSTMHALTPTCTVDGRDYVVVTPQLAGIARKELGPPVADLSPQRQSFITALDLLFTGI